MSAPEEAQVSSGRADQQTQDPVAPQFREPEKRQPPVAAAEAPPEPSGPSTAKPHHAAFGLLVALLVAAGVIALLGHINGFGDLRDRLAGASEGWLAVCFVAQILVFAGYALAYRASIAFESGPVVPYGLAYRVCITTFTATQVVTAGGAAGVALTFWSLHRLGFRNRDAAIRSIGLNTLVYLVFGCLGMLAAALCLVTGAAPLGMTLPWLIGIPLVLMAAAWFTSPRRVERWAADRGGRLRRSLSVGIGAAWFVRRYVRSGSLPVGVTGALLYWLADILSLGGGLLVFGVHRWIGPLMLAYATGYLAQMIPVPFLGTGGVDAATALCLSLVGVPLNAALLGMLAHRLFAFWLPVVPGLVLTATLPSMGRALERVPRPPLEPVAGQ
jgi:uncharacterized membrane protein YbhN (UPF0104 family)